MKICRTVENWCEKHIPLMKKSFYVVLTLIFLIFSSLFFFINRPLCWGWQLDNELFGTYGDFFGGVLGTIFTLITVLLMVKTFSQQRRDNIKNDRNRKRLSKATQAFYSEQNKNNTDAQSKLNEDIRFNSLFFELLRLYQNQVSLLRTNIDGKIIAGKDCFNFWTFMLLQEMREKPRQNGMGVAIVDVYMNVYVENRTNISSVFRTLYRVFDTIEQSAIDEPKKVSYAKIVRAQLSENEMVLLRYNAMCYYGEKFQEYINEYNLLKHVPMMSLLEFSHWSSLLDATEQTGLNMIFNDSLKFLLNKYKKRIDDNEYVYIESNKSKYKFLISYPTPYRIGVSLLRFDNEKDFYREFMAFEKFKDTDCLELLQRFLEYAVLYANFCRYNEESDIKFGTSKTSNQGVTTFEAFAYSISGKRKIQLSYDYKKNDDNGQQ